MKLSELIQAEILVNPVPLLTIPVRLPDLAEWVRLAQDLETQLETASTWIAQQINNQKDEKHDLR